jgi:hypothetical protein
MTETPLTSHPTRYRGIQFRSRLEATWAAFFDGVHWTWEYEPFDLDGYIPDFVLRFRTPLLVEVKPAITPEDFTRYATALDQTAWDQEALLLGIGPMRSNEWWGLPALGVLRETWTHVDEHGEPRRVQGWDEAIGFRCLSCHRVSLHHASGSYHCRVSGCHEGDHHLGAGGPVVADVWAGAKNAVQWQPGR